jgi:hypothetical protein
MMFVIDGFFVYWIAMASPVVAPDDFQAKEVGPSLRSDSMTMTPPQKCG